MTKFRLSMAFLAVILLVPTVLAQDDFSRRGNDLAGRLVDQTRDLADRSYENYRRNSRNSRADTEAVLQDQQLSSNAQLFRRMISDRRSRSELLDATVVLSNLARSTDRFGRERSLLNDIQRTIGDIQRSLNFGGGGGGPFPIPGGGGSLSGSVRWQGTVDDNVYVQIQGSFVDVRAISGTPYNNGSYNFTSALPYRSVNVRLNKIRGRGDMRVIQQPNRDNNFTAIVQIQDSNRGASDYEFELSW